MRLMFTDHPPRIDAPDPRRNRMSGVPAISTPALNRHHGRILRPGQIAVSPHTSEPEGTVYRYDKLLIDDAVFGNEEQVRQISEALASIGMQSDLRCEPGSPRRRCRRVPVSLDPATVPKPVDAWNVLQSLYGKIGEGQADEALLGQVRLEHLLIAASDNSGPGVGGPEPDSNSLLRPQGKIPVDLMVPMPTRRPVENLPGGRRIRVAILDTGVPKEHPAFSIGDRNDGGDPFVLVDNEFQRSFADADDPEQDPLHSPWDEDMHENPLLGELSSHFGHGTFMAGILRQTAPDVQVYSLRVMHNDGLAYEQEVVGALEHVADQVEAAYSGDKEALAVDAVVLSLGYVDENLAGEPGGWLSDIVRRLTALGVPVIAAAGNQASDRPFYPAAFAAQQTEDLAPVLSVGALNPNGNIAMFSNDGPWVSCFATGASVISTFPPKAHGSLSPYRRYRTDYAGRYRESLDPDDFSSGFAVWSGTSFSAPLAASYLARAMEEIGPVVTGGSSEAIARSHAALKQVKEGIA